jgi:integrase/recombinase XerD
MPGYIDRVADAIAGILTREGLGYTQSKAVFKAARRKAGLKAPKERSGARRG